MHKNPQFLLLPPPPPPSKKQILKHTPRQNLQVFRTGLFQIPKGFLPAGFGTAEHQKLMWDTLKSQKVWYFVLDKSQQNRWFQATRKWWGFRKYAIGMLMIICYIGMTLQWWRSLQGSPVGMWFQECDEMLPDGPPADDPPAEGAHDGGRRVAPGGEGGGDGRAIRGSNAAAEKLIAGKNSLYVVATCLADPIHRGMYTLISYITGMVDHEHGKSLVKLKTTMGARFWFIDMASGRAEYVDKCLDALHFQPVLREVGLLTLLEKDTGLHVPANDARIMAGHILNFTQTLLSSEMLYMSAFETMLPGAMFKLLDPSPDVKRDALGYLKRCWDLVEQVLC